MVKDDEVALKVAELLLQIKAIKIEPEKPFTWASGWKSPIYCDNRKILSHPVSRTYVRQQLTNGIENNFDKPHALVGVATGGIAHGVLVAQELGIPFSYVRAEAKKHGMGNQIEGEVPNKGNVVVVEDLVSTGKSSLAAVEILRAHDCTVSQMISIFDYGFSNTEDIFKTAKVDLISLSNYSFLIQKALELGYVEESHMDILKEWRENPAEWGNNFK